MKNLILAAALALPSLAQASDADACAAAANLAGTITDLRGDGVPIKMIISYVAEDADLPYGTLPDVIVFIEAVYDLDLPKKATMNIVYGACMQP